MIDNFVSEEHAKEWLQEFVGKTDEYVHCFNVVRNKLFGEMDSNMQVNVHAIATIKDVTNMLIFETNQKISKKYPEDYGTI